MKGRHRPQRHSAAFRAGMYVLVLVLVAGAAGGAWYEYRKLNRTATPACDGPGDLSIAAAPEIAPAVRALATGWNNRHQQVDGACVNITVSAVAPSDMAAAVAGAHKISINGLGQANGKTTVPNVWIPDSSTWLERLQDASPQLALTGTSIASSPVVVALPEPVAKDLGSGTPSWADLLTKLTHGQLRPGIVDPNVDASGLSALLGFAAAAQSGGTGPDAQAAMVGVIRAFASGESQLRDDLMGRFPRAGDATSIARALSVAPVPEQSVLAYDAAEPPVPLVALYLNPALPEMDYPYTQLPGMNGSQADASEQFQAEMTGNGWTDLLAKSGFRAPDGTYGGGMPHLPGMPDGPITPSPQVPAAQLDEALSTWSAVTVPGRMLAVIDVSGSMAAPVKTAHNASREQVTVAAAQAGLGLFDDEWEVGLWTFSTNLTKTTDYRQLVPIQPLSQGRQVMAQALQGIRPVPNGATGLYDTVLAGYKTVQTNWDPSRVNSVVIMTDGQNQNPNGISLDELLAQIKALKDPARPVEVIAIGIGTDVDKAELTQITDATGGGTFVTADPSKIGEIFLKAIALRPGTAK